MKTTDKVHVINPYSGDPEGFMSTFCGINVKDGETRMGNPILIVPHAEAAGATCKLCRAWTKQK